MTSDGQKTADRGSIDGRLEQVKDAALGAHDRNPSVADEIGEAAGGIAGVLLGAGIGLSAGPVGTLIGGIAGAIGGWWTGRAIAEAAEKLTHEDDEEFRRHYEGSTERRRGGRYEDVRAAYMLGHIASHNPNFVDRQFEEIESQLAKGWDGCSDRPCDWHEVRTFVGEGYRRGVERRSWSDRRVAFRRDETERRSSEERRNDEQPEVF